MMWNVEYTHRAQKARDTTLDDEKYNICNIRERHIECCNNTRQACASVLGDD